MTGADRRFLPALVGVILLAAGCGQATVSPSRLSRRATGKPGVPVEAVLEMIGASSVGAPTRFRLGVTPETDVPDASITIAVPEGARLIDGNLSWKGALRAGEEHGMEMVIAVPGRDRYAVSADVVILEGRGVTLRKRAVIEVDLTKNKGPASAKRPSHVHKAVPLEEFLDNNR